MKRGVNDPREYRGINNCKEVISNARVTTTSINIGFLDIISL